MAQCNSCDDTGHVCENHPSLPWAGVSDAMFACGCGAGMPCPECTTPVPQDGTHSISERFIPREGHAKRVRSEWLRPDNDDLPSSTRCGEVKTDRWFLTHAIWRNGMGSYQPETGVRSVRDGVVQDDFCLIEHGCDRWDDVAAITLRSLDKRWSAVRIGDFIERLAKRRRPKPVYC